MCNIPKESFFGFKIQVQNPGFFLDSLEYCIICTRVFIPFIFDSVWHYYDWQGGICAIFLRIHFGFKIQIQNPGFFPGFPGILHWGNHPSLFVTRGDLYSIPRDLFLLLGFRNPGLFKSQDSREYCTGAFIQYVKLDLGDYCNLN